jgi:hypothetical protein
MSLSALTLTLLQVPRLSEDMAVHASSIAFRTLCSRGFRSNVDQAAEADVEDFVAALSAAGRFFTRRQQEVIRTWLPDLAMPPSIAPDVPSADDSFLIAQTAEDLAVMVAWDGLADVVVDCITEALVDELLDSAVVATTAHPPPRRRPHEGFLRPRKAARRDDEN